MKQYKEALFSCWLGYLTMLLQMWRDGYTIMNEKHLQILKNTYAAYF